MALTATLNPAQYGKLLARTQPRVIETETENERAINELEALDSPARRKTPEESALAELLTSLIIQYEDKHHPDPQLTPLAMLRELMELRQLRQVDLLPVFSASSTVSAVMNGKRAISKSQAKKLAAFFRVPVDLFL